MNIINMLIINKLNIAGVNMVDTKLSRAVDMMIRTDRMHKSMIDSRVKEIGIHRPQHRILMHLARCEKLPSQKELAERLDITPAAVTGALKKIEQSGYIERTLGHDNRYNEIKITDKGRALVNRTRELFSEADISMFEGFTESELEIYIACLEKLQSNIKRQCERSNNL
jgi:DNA-binding MarR family transcriptional regulator